MLIIRNRTQMLSAAVCVTLLSLCAMFLHLHINYDSDMRSLVRVKAMVSTVVVSLPLSLVVMHQMLKNQRLSDELQRLVNRDRLTDVATRDFFFARLTEFPDAYGVSLMIDIDHFKQVNDRYGHLAGDDVIHAVAQNIRAQIRERDIVCRFGGEEFVVFLHSASPETGWTIAERIRDTIQDATTQTSVGGIKVTVSVGGSMKEQLEDVDEAVKRADDCLYRAKATGRNRTVVDWSEVQKIAKDGAA